MFECDTIGKEKKNRLRKTDILLGTGLLIFALFLLFSFEKFGQKGAMAEITYAGNLIGKIDLSVQDKTYYLLQISDKGEADFTKISPETVEKFDKSALLPSYNLIFCENGTLRMIQSDCPDKICVHHAAISKTGESIICLPHKIVVQITGAEEKTLDGVTY